MVCIFMPGNLSDYCKIAKQNLAKPSDLRQSLLNRFV